MNRNSINDVVHFYIGLNALGVFWSIVGLAVCLYHELWFPSLVIACAIVWFTRQIILSLNGGLKK